MLKLKKIKITSWIFALIVVISLVSTIAYGYQKQGYHMDELCSYGLANSEYLPFMHFGESGYDVKDWMLEYGAGESFGQMFGNLYKDYQILKEYDFQFYATPIYEAYRIAQENSADTRTTTWVSGEDYLHYVAVSPENTFNYASVYYNQRGDVHPPFFYILLHTVCSVFQGSFSKWYGIGVNTVFMLMTLVVLYRMCSKYLGGEVFGLCVAAVYGLSNGFVSTAIFIRMYAILTFMIVSSCCIHMEIAENDFKMTKSSFWRLVAVTFLGFFTHYYFVLYAIGIAVVYCIWMVCRKNFRRMITYILTMMGTGAFGICVWPFAIRHVFQGYRGMDAVQESLSGGAYWLKFRIMLKYIWPYISGGREWLIVLPVVLVVVVALLWKRKTIPYGRIAILCVPIVFYVAFTAQIVPYLTDRYVMCSFPFWCVFMVGGVYHTVRIVFERFELTKTANGKQGLWCVVGCLTGLLVLSGNCFMRSPAYIYPDGQDTVQVPENTDCVYVLPDGDWNESVGDSAILAKCRRVGVVYESELSCLQADDRKEGRECLMVCVQNELDAEKVLKQVRETFEAHDLQEVSRVEGTSAVRIFLKR